MFRRGRRLRTNSVIRSLVRENSLSTEDFIYPVFIVEGNNIKREIRSLKGNYHWSVDKLEELVKELNEAKVKSVILFGIPEHKDCVGSEAYNDDGIVQKAIRKLKELDSNLYIITDVCMCEYTNHGHCGILSNNNVDNDKTLVYLGEIALSHVKAGADMVAPSDMMDGRIGYIREVLDKNGFENIPIMSYAAKYSSAFYGPFREAAGSAPSFGNRKGYQMDPANSREAIAEIEADLNEGADIIMVKPAMSYLDIVKEVLDKNGFENIPIMSYAAKYSSAFYGPFREAAGSAPSFGNRKGYQMDPANSREAIAEIEADLNEGADIIMVKPAMSYLDIVKEAREKINAPICVYNVSGEYAMVKNAGEVGLINEKLVALEMLLSMKRAGAKMIITYYALEAAKWLKEDEI